MQCRTSNLFKIYNECCSLANTAGVFHLSSPEGKYKMNFSQANTACQAEGATLATYKQLADAQQVNAPPFGLFPLNMSTLALMNNVKG